jgi:hypothetical protein
MEFKWDKFIPAQHDLLMEFKWEIPNDLLMEFEWEIIPAQHDLVMGFEWNPTQ